MLRRLTIAAAGICFILALASILMRPAPRPRSATPEDGAIDLNGERVVVHWSDGDSFQIREGPHAGTNVRLKGFNALEAYGPVHRWGDWTARELYAIARNTKRVGAARVWSCRSDLTRDKYDRLLVFCPGVGEWLVSRGLAHVFAVDLDPDPKLLAAQRAAQEAGRGMWAKGIPSVIVTSLHSVAEGRGYNRVADTATGRSEVVEHEHTYEICQEVCLGEEGRQSCLVYVPYERRYENQPDCLR